MNIFEQADRLYMIANLSEEETKKFQKYLPEQLQQIKSIQGEVWDGLYEWLNGFFKESVFRVSDEYKNYVAKCRAEYKREYDEVQKYAGKNYTIPCMSFEGCYNEKMQKKLTSMCQRFEFKKEQ